MDSRLVFHGNRMIFNQWTKLNIRSFRWFSRSPFKRCFPVCQEVLIMSQTWLQPYSRGTFFYSAYLSFSNTISLRSVWCWRAMIPGNIFTGFAKFKGIVSVNDIWFPCRLQELLQAPFRLLRSFFCTVTIESNESPSLTPRQRIDDCFVIHFPNWGLCDRL